MVWIAVNGELMQNIANILFLRIKYISSQGECVINIKIVSVWDGLQRMESVLLI